MTEFLVTWEIELDEDSPKRAAMEALRIQLDPESEALFFRVKNTATGEEFDVNLFPRHDPEDGNCSVCDAFCAADWLLDGVCLDCREEKE